MNIVYRHDYDNFIQITSGWQFRETPLVCGSMHYPKVYCDFLWS